MRISALTLCLSLICLAAAPLPGSAQSSIKVIVNDHAVTSYDIKQRTRLITLTRQRTGSTARKQAEEELVDERLKLDEAKRIGISVSDQEISGAYGNIARSVKMSPKQLSSALSRSGVNPKTLKARLSAQIAWQKVVQRRFQGQIDIDESDVIAALRKSDKKDQNTSLEYDLSQVIVVIPKKSSSSFKSKRKRESENLRSSFSSCTDAGAILGQYSEVVLRPIGRRLETELSQPMRDAVKDVEIGRLSKPRLSGRGYEMIAVCGMREIKSDIAARTEMENELRAKEGEQQSRRYLRDLRRRATIVQR